ncbi:hypothetical protein PINS_up023785 [Pythium insidiosum]|nr:hypothetical protein PINS_up023785 [Pythium insidiosum]
MGKTNVLLQALVGRARVSNFTLISDTNYVAQNASRVCRALFEICLRKHSARRAEKFLQLGNSIEQRLWWDQSLLLQLPNVPPDVVALVEAQHIDVYSVLAGDDDSKPSQQLTTLPPKARKWISMLPFVAIDEAAGVHVQPVGGNMCGSRSRCDRCSPRGARPRSRGARSATGSGSRDAVTGFIYHSEYGRAAPEPLPRVAGRHDAARHGVFRARVWRRPDVRRAPAVGSLCRHRDVLPRSSTRRLRRRLTTQQRGRRVTTRCTRSCCACTHQPLQSLANPVYEALYADSFAFLNPIQTQAFHQLYHQDGNVLLCAPTGSGKTLCAELAMLRVVECER